MRRVHQSVNTLFALVMSVGGACVSCASESSQDGGSTDTATTGSTTSASPSTGATGASSTRPQTSNSSASPSPTGASGSTQTSAAMGATSTNNQTGGSVTSSPGSNGTSTENPNTETMGPSGSQDNGTSSDTTTSGSNTESAVSNTSGAGSDETASSEPDLPGECNQSSDTGRNASGTGPHEVVIETNSDEGIRCGTIFRPADLGGAEKYPILVWGEGGCSQNGLSNQAAMAEIASWGYFIVADGTPNGENACQGGQSGAAFLDYISWAMDENRKPCSAYYQSLDTTKIAADGFSCGGLMAENVAGDPRFTAIGITSSGLMGPNNNLWDSMHAPFKIMNGGSSDIAYQNGLNDYEAISARGIPILYFSKTTAGHGGDLGQGRGDFNLVNLAWLNWQLKGDEGDTGKAFLIGPSCAFCDDSGWEFMSANIE